MSGGYFDYQQDRIEDIADEIGRLVETNDSDELDEWGDPVGRHYTPETIKTFDEAQRTLRRAAAMVQRIDWLLECDDSEETFHERWEQEVGNGSWS